MERSLILGSKLGKIGLIVPISLTCTQRMASLQNTLLNKSAFIWNSTYAERPDKLFSGAEVLLTITISAKGIIEEKQVYSTGLRKWKSDEREHLFENTAYYSSSKRLRNYILPKKSSVLEESIVSKIWHETEVLASDLRINTPFKVFYRIGGGRYWKVFTNFQPKFILNGKSSVSSRESHLFFDSSETRDITITALSSTLFYWYFVITTNGRDLNPSDLKLFPITSGKINETRKKTLINLCFRLLEDYKINKQEKEKTSKQTGDIIYEEFYPRLSKPIIDEIDKVLAEHYGFTEEELDFIINYDIKYRMGKELRGEDEESTQSQLTF